MHATAAFHQMLSSLANNSTKTSHQHAELGNSRLRKDMNDLNTMLKWFDFQLHNPSEETRVVLQSLGTGLIADDTVHCDRGEEVSSKIQKRS